VSEQEVKEYQGIRGAQKNRFTIDSLPTIVSKKSIGTATILGLRMKIVF